MTSRRAAEQTSGGADEQWIGPSRSARLLNGTPARAALLLAPFVFYLVPFLAGYGWSALSPMTPRFAGMPTPPERESALPTAVEHYGTGVVVVPFQARLRAYLRDGDHAECDQVRPRCRQE